MGATAAAAALGSLPVCGAAACRSDRRSGIQVPQRLNRAPPAAPPCFDADAATALHWLLGGRLVVAAACGLLVCMQLSEQPQAGQPQEVAAVALADSVTLMQLSPCDYEAAPPPAGPEEEDNGTATVAPDAVAAAAAVSAATAAAAAALVPCSKSSPPPAGEALPIAASLPTSTSLTAAGPGAPLNLNGHTAAGHYDAAPGLSPAAALPPIAARQASIGNGSNGNGQARPRARGARGGVGRSGDRGGDATPAGGSGGSAGFSASLMHHIQAIRDNPPQQGGGRSDHHQQLAGWGLGAWAGGEGGARSGGTCREAAVAAASAAAAHAGKVSPILSIRSSHCFLCFAALCHVCRLPQWSTCALDDGRPGRADGGGTAAHQRRDRLWRRRSRRLCPVPEPHWHDAAPHGDADGVWCRGGIM